MDQITARKQRLSFAKICVELEVMKKIPKSIKVKLRNDNIVDVYVEVTWRPQRCLHCGIFGHVDKACLQKPIVAKVWMPKKTINNVVEDQIVEKVASKPINKAVEDQIMEKATSRPREEVIGSSSGKNDKASSMNRFVVLDIISDNEEIIDQETVLCIDSANDDHVELEVGMGQRKT